MGAKAKKREEEPMDLCTCCLICEGVEEADYETTVKAWQTLIDSGTVWQLQGWYGRTAHELILRGICHA